MSALFLSAHREKSVGVLWHCVRNEATLHEGINLSSKQLTNKVYQKCFISTIPAYSAERKYVLQENSREEAKKTRKQHLSCTILPKIDDDVIPHPASDSVCCCWAAISVCSQTFTYKSLLGLVPSYLGTYMCRNQNQYGRCSHNTLQMLVLRVRTESGKKGFQQAAASPRNNVQKDLKWSELITILKENSPLGQCDCT